MSSDGMTNDALVPARAAPISAYLANQRLNQVIPKPPLKRMKHQPGRASNPRLTPAAFLVPESSEKYPTVYFTPMIRPNVPTINGSFNAFGMNGALWVSTNSILVTPQLLMLAIRAPISP